MNIYNNLIDSLRPLRLYDLGENSNNALLLKVFAGGLQQVYDKAQEISSRQTDEQRILSLYRLDNTTGADGAEKSEIIAACRRTRLGRGTRADYENLITSAGITAEITELPSEEKLQLKITDFVGEYLTTLDVYLRLLRIFPCHLGMDTTILLLSFDDHDAENQTFDTIDGKNSSFEHYVSNFAITMSV